MSNDNNPNNSIKMTESSFRNYSKEETKNQNNQKNLAGKHQKLFDEKDDNSIEISTNITNKKKKQCIIFLY